MSRSTQEKQILEAKKRETDEWIAREGAERGRVIENFIDELPGRTLVIHETEVDTWTMGWTVGTPLYVLLGLLETAKQEVIRRSLR